MNPVIPISIERLHPNPENPLPPLPEDEFADLRNSIGKYGIVESLFIVQDKKSPKNYVVIAGNHRLKAAQELGISEIPCTVIRQDDIESAYETELYRRTLTKQERKHYAQKIHEAAQQQREEEIKDSLIDELYQLYSQKRMSTVEVQLFLGLSKEEQRKLHETMQKKLKDTTEPPSTTDQEELKQAKQKYAQLESHLESVEKEKQDLERRNRDAKRLLKEKMEELEEVREQSTQRAAETIKEQVSQQIIAVQTQVTRSSEALKEKDNEMEKLREERDKANRELRDNEARIKAVWLASRTYYDQCRTAMNIMFRPDLLRKRVANIKTEMEMLETVWNSYDIDESLKNEIYGEMKVIEGKVHELLKTLPQIQGPKLPAITSRMIEQSKMLSNEKDDENERQVLQ